MFCNFCKKFENSKWPPFLARQLFFENWDGYSSEIPCGSKILSKSLYLARFSRYKHFCVLQFSKNLKIQNSRHFWREKFFFFFSCFSMIPDDSYSPAPAGPAKRKKKTSWVSPRAGPVHYTPLARWPSSCLTRQRDVTS